MRPDLLRVTARSAVPAIAALVLATVPACSSGGAETPRSAAAATLPPAPRVATDPPDVRRRYFLSRNDIVRMRHRVVDRRFGRVAWEKTARRLPKALAATPRPVPPDGDYGPSHNKDCGKSKAGWYCGLYRPGLRDGRFAYELAIAYAVTGKPAYARKSRAFLLAWATTYNPPPPTGTIGHMVAEPVGFMLKAFLAYDLVKDTFTPAQQDLFEHWAGLFVARGEKEADSARDHPWVPQAPWGNSATWARSLAVVAAAVVGGQTLDDALAWNWEHTTPGGKPYGWIDLLQGAMRPNGHMVEEDVRHSVDYALFTWQPLALIANVARVSGAEHDLWTAKAPDGQSLRKPIRYYAPYLRRTKTPPRWYWYDHQHLGRMLAQYRAVMETATRRFPEWRLLRKVVGYGGYEQRGRNRDPHITFFNSLTGRR